MTRNGVAKGKVSKIYNMTEADQGKYHYVYGPYAAPVLTVDPGAQISVETHDAFEGKIKHETDIPSQILNFPTSIRRMVRSLLTAQRRETVSPSISRRSGHAARNRRERPVSFPSLADLSAPAKRRFSMHRYPNASRRSTLMQRQA